MEHLRFLWRRGHPIFPLSIQKDGGRPQWTDLPIGVSQVLMGLFFNGLWIALIGWFIHSAATRGYGEVFVKEMLKDVRAQDLMDTAFETVGGSISVQELVEDYILKKRERAFLVTEAGNLAGIVCRTDILDFLHLRSELGV